MENIVTAPSPPASCLVTETLKPGNERFLSMAIWGLYESLAMSASWLDDLLVIPELICSVSA